MSRKHVGIAVLLAAGMLSLTACTPTSVPDSIQVSNIERNVIQVNASEQVKVVPDMAEIVFGVYSQAQNAQDCQTQNNLEVDRVLQMLEEFGNEQTSIQTSGYDLNPIYDWNSGQTITGYEMSTDITVSNVVLEQVGNLIGESVDAGINHIKSVTYLSSKYDESYQQALKQAVESARLKATALAEAGNATLGAIVRVEEYNQNQQARYTGYQRSAKEEIALDAAAMGVMPGEVSVEARILVEFEIK